MRSLRPRHLLTSAVLAAGAALAQPVAQSEAGAIPVAVSPGRTGELSVLTYNVKGLPWPVATGRDAPLEAIGGRLARMRREGRQPGIVVLQEAFADRAKAIAEQAGYAWNVQGPYARTGPGVAPRNGGLWRLGETGPAMLDSGIAVLSDYPVLAVERAAFPEGACAGFDCLAAKGVLLVTVAVPGIGEVAIAATHLNSRKASGAQFQRTHVAYARQVVFLREFVARHLPSGAQLIVVGDFNRGARPARIAALDSARHALALDDALAALAGQGQAVGREDEMQWIAGRARDLQFFKRGKRSGLVPVAGEVPFGREPDGSMLSDHMGFTIHYRTRPRDRAA